MKTGIRSVAAITAISAMFLFVSDIRAENFTLSDEGIMMLHQGNYYRGTKASIMAKKDVPGPGVEFEIYMPAGRAFEGLLDMVCSNLER